jgi:hypothetical protein
VDSTERKRSACRPASLLLHLAGSSVSALKGGVSVLVAPWAAEHTQGAYGRVLELDMS